MTTRIFFVRHGEVNNPNKIWYGRLPGFSLSSNGKKQILKAAQVLSVNKIDAIYASPLLRTKQSAMIITDTFHLPVNYSNNLLEVNSSLQGKTFAYIFFHSIKFNVFASPKNKIIGETIEQLSNRMQEFIAGIIKFYEGKNIIAVTHGDPIMIVKAQIEKLPIRIGSIRPIRGYIKQGKICMVEFNSQ